MNKDIYDHFKSCPPHIANAFWFNLRAKWPQVNDETKLCKADDYQYSIKIPYPVENSIRNWNDLMPKDSPGIKPALWRIAGKKLKKPDWVSKGQFTPIPPMPYRPIRELKFETLEVVDNGYAKKAYGLFVCYDNVTDTLYMSRVHVHELPL